MTPEQVIKPHPPIWYLRHGQTDWNAARRIQGQLNSHLNDLGRWHAREQAQIMAPILELEPDILVSPLARTLETAEIALAGQRFRIDPRLMEIHAGAWQGLTYDAVFDGWPGLARRDMSALAIFSNAPEGESLETFRRRIIAVLDEITQPTVIVAHGLWGQVARAHIRGLSDAEMFRLDNLQGVVYKLENRQETVLRAPV